jgi:hypothetical protein
VRVPIKGKLYAGVSQEVSDHLRVNAATDQQGSAGVAKVAPGYVRLPCAAEQELEVPIHDVLSV